MDHNLCNKLAWIKSEQTQMLFDGISPFSKICLRKVIFQIMVLNGGHLVKWLHCWGRTIQLCTSSSKLFSIALPSVLSIIFINEWLKLTFVIHTLANIAWWRPSWKMANRVERCNMPLITVKMSPIVFIRSDRCHIPKISTWMNWKWTLSLAFGTHYTAGWQPSWNMAATVGKYNVTLLF